MQKIFSVQVQHKSDMAQVEELVVSLLGGEHHRCAFLRSEEFVKLRTQALYHRARDDARVHRCVHVEGLKITLDPSGNVCVFLVDPFSMSGNDVQGGDGGKIPSSSTSTNFPLELGKRRRDADQARGSGSPLDDEEEDEQNVEEGVAGGEDCSPPFSSLYGGHAPVVALGGRAC